MLSLINSITGRMAEEKKEVDTTSKEEDVNKANEETAPTDVKEEAKPNDPEETPANDEKEEKDKQAGGSKETPVVTRTRRQRGDSQKIKEDEVEDEITNEEEPQEEEEKESLTAKRTRRKKSVAAYEPVDFKNAKCSVTIMRGRGMTLGDIPAIRAQVQSFSMNSEEMKLAHRLVYKYRGRISPKEYKRNLLAFSGYLREMNSDEDEEALAPEDEEAETYYSVKAYKLNTEQIKTLVDFFSIDRSPEKGVPMNKDFLIDRLLDFLGAPSLDELKDDKPSPEAKKSSSSKTKAAPSPAAVKESSSSPKTKTAPAPVVKESSPPPKKRKRTEKESEEDDGDDDRVDKEEEMKVTHEDWVKKARIEGAFFMVRQHSKGEAPSDEALRQWVQAYVACFDMDTSSIKHAIKTASAKFGVDMRDRKDTIREFLVSEI